MPYIVGRLSNPRKRTKTKTKAKAKARTKAKAKSVKRATRSTRSRAAAKRGKSTTKELRARHAKRIRAVKASCQALAKKQKESAVRRAIGQVKGKRAKSALWSAFRMSNPGGFTGMLLPVATSMGGTIVGTYIGALAQERVVSMLESSSPAVKSLANLLLSFGCNFLAVAYGDRLHGAAGAAAYAASVPANIGLLQSLQLDMPGVTMFGTYDDAYDYDDTGMDGVVVANMQGPGSQLLASSQSALPAFAGGMNGTVNLNPSFSFGQLMGRA